MTGRPRAIPNWSGDAPDPSSSSAPWRLYNIGNNRSVEVAKVVDLLERELGRKAVKELVDMQPGEVPETCADIDDLMRAVGLCARDADRGRHCAFVSWYRDFYRSG